MKSRLIKKGWSRCPIGSWLNHPLVTRCATVEEAMKLAAMGAAL